MYFLVIGNMDIATVKGKKKIWVKCTAAEEQQLNWRSEMDFSNVICPFTGSSLDERIDIVCQYCCTVQNLCPLGYENIAQDFADEDDD